MTTYTGCTRFPEELKDFPALIGEKNGKRIVVFYEDIDGFRYISQEEAEERICGFLLQQVPLPVFVDLMKQAGNVIRC